MLANALANALAAPLAGEPSTAPVDLMINGTFQLPYYPTSGWNWNATEIAPGTKPPMVPGELHIDNNLGYVGAVGDAFAWNGPPVVGETYLFRTTVSEVTTPGALQVGTNGDSHLFAVKDTVQYAVTAPGIYEGTVVCTQVWPNVRINTFAGQFIGKITRLEIYKL